MLTRWTYALLLALALGAVGCRDPETHSEVVGASLLAVHTEQEAARVAERMLERRPEGCHSLTWTTRERSWRQFTSTSQLQITRLGEDGRPEASPLLEILTRARRDERGHVNLHETSRHRTRWSETPGTRSRELRYADGRWFTREDGSDFVTASGLEADARLHLTEAAEAFERLTALDPSRGCALPEGARVAWLEPLAREGALRALEVEAEPGPDGLPRRRTLRAEIQLITYPGSTLLITLEETHQPGRAEPVPTPGELAPASTPRDYWTARRLLRRLFARRLLGDELDLF